MKKILSITLISLLGGCFVGCKKDDPSVNFPVNSVVIKKAYDIGNNNNASDIRVDLTFDPSVNLSDIMEVRFIISKALIKEEVAKTLPATNYHAISAVSADQVAKLEGSLKDAEGGTITDGVDYKLYCALTARGNAFFLSKPVPFTLKNKPIYVGDYKGIWSDALFKNTEVTMRLLDDYTGEVYYSNSFQACCGGTSDGTVKVVFNGTTITSFVVNQYLGSYKGGHCTATYNAKGSVSDDITLLITDLTGSDCDGNHTPGTIKFTRQ
jgi:hypothetical protein